MSAEDERAERATGMTLAEDYAEILALLPTASDHALWVAEQSCLVAIAASVDVDECADYLDAIKAEQARRASE